MAQYYTSALFAILALASTAAIPVRWTTDAYKVKPLVYECYHGETLDLAAALTAYGEPLNFAGKTAKLYWQTNGMNQVWWSTNAFVRAEGGVSNVLAAIWSGAYDTGAASVTGFIGVEGENYRAAFQLNFRASPGFVPNAMPIPPQTIDWAKVSNTNVDSAPFALKGSGGGGVTTNDVRGIVEGYGYVTESVTNGLASTNYVNEAIASIPPSMTTNAVKEISSTQITNSVLAGYLCTSNAAAQMASGAYVAATNVADTIVRDATAFCVKSNDEGSVSILSELNARHINAIGKVTGNEFILHSYDWTTQLEFGTFGFFITRPGVGLYLKYPDVSGTFALTSDISSATNALATVAHTGSYDDLSNKPTIPAPVSDSHITNIAEAVSAPIATTANNAITTANSVSNRQDTLEGYVAGQRVRVSVTNYYGNTSGELPRLRIEEYVTETNVVNDVETPTNYWRVVWDENNKYMQFFTNTIAGVASITNGLQTWCYQLVMQNINTKAPRAWGTLTSAGEAAPAGTVWHTEPNTVFAGGTEYAHAMVGTGVIGVLTTKGAAVYTDGETGRFHFTTDDKTYFFGMNIASRYELGCATDGITVTSVGGNQMVELLYNVTMSGKPILYYTPNLTSPITWEQITDSTGESIPGATVSASWEQSPPAGSEICDINCGQGISGFFKATIEYAGVSKFETNMMSDLKGGIIATNETSGQSQPVEPYISNGAVLWRVKQ